MLLIDEMKAHLPITAYASRHLSKALIANGFDVAPEKELKILNVVESGEEGGIACCLDIPENFVVSLTLLRVRQDHPLHEKIMNYQKKRIRKIFKSNGLGIKRMKQIFEQEKW